MMDLFTEMQKWTDKPTTPICSLLHQDRVLKLLHQDRVLMLLITGSSHHQDTVHNF